MLAEDCSRASSFRSLKAKALFAAANRDTSDSASTWNVKPETPTAASTRRRIDFINKLQRSDNSSADCVQIRDTLLCAAVQGGHAFQFHHHQLLVDLPRLLDHQRAVIEGHCHAEKSAVLARLSHSRGRRRSPALGPAPARFVESPSDTG